MKKLLFAISIFGVCSSSALDRIQALRFDRSSVQRIYLAPGLGSVLLFPCSLEEVFIGRSEDLRALISPNDKKTLFLNLKLNSSLPTNVIAKCAPERWVFVFDVIPNRIKHQDFVEIRGTFGRPKNQDTHLFVETKRDESARRIVLKTPELVKEGRKR